MWEGEAVRFPGPRRKLRGRRGRPSCFLCRWDGFFSSSSRRLEGVSSSSIHVTRPTK